MGREFLDYLEDILHSAQSIQMFVLDMTYDDFCGDEKTIYAVIQGFQIIGEAAKHIPQNVQIRYPEIDWNSMSKMRDLLIHHYFNTQYSILWETIQNRIPALLKNIPRVIRENPS